MSRRQGTRTSGARRIRIPLVVLLALIAALALRGPVVYRRVVHPLKYETEISAASERYDIDPYLIAAVINAESGFRKDEVSRKGAVGLMQLMPTTAEEAQRTSHPEKATEEVVLKDPKVNIDLGTHHLGKLMKRYPSQEWALAAYNAGAANADRWSREATSGRTLDAIRFPVTRRYVAKVLEERDDYEELYPDAFRGGKK